MSLAMILKWWSSPAARPTLRLLLTLSATETKKIAEAIVPKKVETPGQPCRALLSRRNKARFAEEVCESRIKTSRYPRPRGLGDTRFEGGSTA